MLGRPPVLAVATVVAILTLVTTTPEADWRGGGTDDAYITYRYAENLAHGQGFVFNPGGPAVLGTTTPLFTLLLAAGAKLGADIPTLSVSIGIAGAAVTLVLVVLLADALGLLAAGLAVAITWTLSAVPFQAVSGMETPLYMALIVGGLYALVRERRVAALTIAALAAVTRPDGLALVAVAATVFAARGVWSWRAALPGALILAGWITFATLVFGSPLPSSGVAKMSQRSDISGTFSFLDPSAIAFVLPVVVARPPYAGLADPAPGDTADVWPWTLKKVWLWVVCVLVVAQGLGLGLVSFARRWKARVILLWMVVYTLGYTLLHVPNFAWYYAPVALLGALLFWSGVQHLSSRLAAGRGSGSVPTIVLALGLALVTSVASVPPEKEAAPHRLAGLWLRDHALPDQWVVAYEVGTVAYLSNLRTVDILGLTDPAALPFVEAGDYAWALRARPDYVFIPEPSPYPVIEAVYAAPGFLDDYRVVARFPTPGTRDYLLYGRV